jgi:DNA-binding PadR family transcriptional regulator
MHTRYVAVPMSLLALLDGGPMYGYQLKTAFEGRTGGVWPLNVGQVYTTLDRLARDGLVTPVAGGDGDKNQRAYAITAEGRSALVGWLEEGPAESPPRDELLVKVLLIASSDPASALEVVGRQRTALFETLQARRRRQRASDGDLANELVHEALAVRAEADLRWLDRCEERLRALLPTNGKKRKR